MIDSVCVIGGGPAGSTFATRLAMLGHDVSLVERKRFPRRRLGESLSPGVLPLLEMTGVRGAVEAAAFTPVRSVRVTWEDGVQERRDPREEGLLVDRGRFDRILLDRAKALGVRVLQPAHIESRERTDAGWALRVRTGKRTVELSARMLADASGRAAALRGNREATGPRTIALHGYWRGTQVPDQPRIEAGDECWLWGVPLPDGSYNTLVFVEASRLKNARSAGRLFRELLDRSGIMDGCEDVRLVTPVRAADTTPYIAADCVTADTIAVGDAALAIDPLSSSGVQKAVQTALSAAVVANTILRRPADTDAAMAFYRGSVREASDRHLSWAAGHYSLVAEQNDAPFWNDRAANAEPPVDELSDRPRPLVSPDAPLEVSPDVAFEDVPCLGREFVSVRQAVRHPLVEGPVAFLGGFDVARLLATVRPGMTARDLVGSWVGDIPPEGAVAVAEWFVTHGILRPRAD